MKELWLETDPDTFELWRGEPIESGDPDLGAVTYPAQIADLWSPEELTAVGLYAPAHDAVPAGKVIASSTVARVGGVVKFVDSYEDIVITADEVNAERDRRIGLGMPVQPTGIAEPFVMQTRDPDDFRNINGLSTAALALANMGSTQTISVRDAADVQHDLSLGQVIELGLQVQGGVSAIYEKSWALKAMSPIPLDFAADGYWT